MKKHVTIISAILIAFILLVDILLFVIGSFEMYPTAEQLEKGRLVYGLFFLPLLAVETFLISKILHKR